MLMKDPLYALIPNLVSANGDLDLAIILIKDMFNYSEDYHLYLGTEW